MSNLPLFVRVYNTAVGEQVVFEKINIESIEEAKIYRDQLRNEYGGIGCHEVKLLMELYPDNNTDIDEEEEFDFDEMKEEE